MQKIKELFSDSWVDAWTLQQVHMIDRQYQTPCYLLNGAKARENIRILKDLLGEEIEICYAVKANPWLAKSLLNMADRWDVCTEGEWQRCLDAGIEPGKLLYEGPYKARGVLTRMMDSGVQRISIDSVDQWKEIHELAGRRRDWKVKALLRLNGGGQFGMDAEEIIEILRGSHRGDVVGIHYYAGTQRQYPRQVRTELEHLKRQIEDIEHRAGRKIDELEFGAGTAVPYFESDHVEDFAEALGIQIEFAQRMSHRYHVVFEVGRCVSAAAGVFLTRVIGKKQLHGQRHVFLDGGTNLLSYYGGMSGQRTPQMKLFCHQKTGDLCSTIICGCLCSASDIFARKKQLPAALEIGDYIMFRNAGAYAIAESCPQFLSMDFPPIMMYNERKNVWEIIRRRIPSILLDR